MAILVVSPASRAVRPSAQVQDEVRLRASETSNDGGAGDAEVYDYFSNRLGGRGQEAPDTYSNNHTGFQHIVVMRGGGPDGHDFFRFFIHPDDCEKDNCGGRSRNEIKGEGGSPNVVTAKNEGDVHRYHWYVRIPTNFDLGSGNDDHYIHQIHGNHGPTSRITLENNEDGLEVSHQNDGDDGDSHTLADPDRFPISLSEITGRWLEFEEVIKARDSGGLYRLFIWDDDGSEILHIERTDLDTWSGDYQRPKWGLYCSEGTGPNHIDMAEFTLQLWDEVPPPMPDTPGGRPVLLSIVANPSQIDFHAPGQTVPLEAVGFFRIGQPQDITGQVIWNVSNTGVVTVNSADTAVAVGPGTAQITASLDGIISNSIQVSVDTPIAVLESITASPASVTLEIDGFTSLFAIGRFSDDSQQDVTLDALWTSSSPGIAVAIPGGEVEAISPGVAQVRAQLDGIQSNPVQVTVLEAPQPEVIAIAISPTQVTVDPGDTVQFQATGHLDDGSQEDITSQVTWITLGSLDVAVIDLNGVLSAISPGSVGVIATLDGLTSNEASVMVAVGSGTPGGGFGAVLATASVVAVPVLLGIMRRGS